MIDIKDLDKVSVLKCLYDMARCDIPNTSISLVPIIPLLDYNEAVVIINSSYSMYFDYIKGRCLKVDLSSDLFDERLYDRDNGVGMAARAVNMVKSRGV